jgi:molybdopterin synthase sulfur carrier subunit
MATIFIPSLLRDVTQGHESLTIQGTSISQIIESLEETYPGMRARLCTDHGLQPGIAVAVDGQISRLGLLQQVQPESEIHFLPAISGG